MSRLLQIAGMMLMAAGVAGCTDMWGLNATTPLAPPVSTTDHAAGIRTTAARAPATPEAARVDQIGRKLLAANRELRIAPIFVVPSSPELEVFHQGQSCVYVTEGLVKQCRTDGELAAILSMELAKIVAEEEGRSQVLTAHGEVVSRPQPAPEREPMPELRIGPDAGSFGEPDPLYKAEVAKMGFDKRTKEPRKTSPSGSKGNAISSPDPEPMARSFLQEAGYADGDLQVAQPLLQAAAKNSKLAKQLAPARSGR